MDETSVSLLRQLLLQEVLFLALSVIFMTLAITRGFFRISQPCTPSLVSFKHLAFAFLIYFCATLLISHLISWTVGSMIPHHLTESKSNVLYVSWVNLLMQTVALLALVFCFFKWLPHLLKKILVPHEQSATDWAKAIFMGVLGCIIALPLVHLASNTFDLVMNWFFNVAAMPDQQAVKYLKSAMDTPLSFLLAFLSIVVLAPLLEELLFRGFLQNWLKNYLGRAGSILLTSLIFSCFHYSTSQGLANISVISSLFVLAIFLGFIYERQQNLIASVAMHATFNGISVFSIFLYRGI